MLTLWAIVILSVFHPWPNFPYLLPKCLCVISENPFDTPRVLDSRRTSEETKPFVRSIAFIWYWMVLTLGISFSGALFGAGMMANSMTWGSMGGVRFEGLGLVLLAAVVGGILASIVGGALAMFVCITYYYLNLGRTARLSWRTRLLGDVLCGGTSGLVCTLLLTAGDLLGSQSLLMMGSAALLGALGGALASLVISLKLQNKELV